MRLSAPAYYREFSCIADRCKHSCCVGWEIDIDAKTERKYEALGGGYGAVIKASLENSESLHFKLDSSGRCPHLDARGLCRIITELGDGYLCDICRLHPRFYNYTKRGAEAGLGMACEAAAELILSSDGYSEISEIRAAREEGTVPDFDILPIRESIFSVLSDRAVPYGERLNRIYERYGVSPRDIPDEEWQELISSLEYLDSGSRVKFSAFSASSETPRECEVWLERALAYFVYRHCSSSLSADEARMKLGACLFLERLLASLASADGVRELSSMVELARLISSELEYSEENTEAIESMFL